MLNKFVAQYDKVVHVHEEAEEREGFVTMNTMATLSGTHPIEKVIGERYTQHVFKKF